MESLKKKKTENIIAKAAKANKKVRKMWFFTDAKKSVRVWLIKMGSHWFEGMFNLPQYLTLCGKALGKTDGKCAHRQCSLNLTQHCANPQRDN